MDFATDYPRRLPLNKVAPRPQATLNAAQYAYTEAALVDDLISRAPLGAAQAPQCRRLARFALAEAWKLGESVDADEAEGLVDSLAQDIEAQLHPLETKTTESVEDMRQAWKRNIGNAVNWVEAAEKLAAIDERNKIRAALADGVRPTARQFRRWHRVATNQAFETVSDILRVQKKYASAHSVKRRIKQNEANGEWLGRKEVIDMNTGEILRLCDIARSVEARFAEFYTIMKGVEKIAAGDGLGGLFITATLPPKFHPNPSVGTNSWAGYTPTEGQREITRRWARVRARLHKEGIKELGVRVAEPHKDGCPHAHFLTFCKRGEAGAVAAAFRAGFGQSAQAVKVEVIDTAKGSAVSYVSKYVMKSLAAGEDAGEVDAWRACWNIRAFQFFGLPRRCLTYWREFRRVKSEPADGTTAAIWRAARRGDGETFIRLLAHNSADYELIQVVPNCVGVRAERLRRFFGIEAEAEAAAASRVVGFRHIPTGNEYRTHGDWVLGLATVISKCPSAAGERLKKPPDRPPKPPPLRLVQAVKREQEKRLKGLRGSYFPVVAKVAAAVFVGVLTFRLF